ncbi:hypothetical protein BDW22DRAFT_923841 [Trametopsis cervina]|nr:hypothetical protein BDW22DRAFT_923841 [Trametopsis cervina]
MTYKYHTFLDYPGQLLGGFIVPQRRHIASQQYPPHQTIRFTHNGRPGVNLHDTLRLGAGGMPDADVRPITTTSSTNIGLRINWQGYADFSSDIRAHDSSQRMELIQKRELAFRVAQVVRKFYQAVLSFGDRDGHYTKWELTETPFECLRLLELQHVSPDTWQPVLLVQV